LAAAFSSNSFEEVSFLSLILSTEKKFFKKS